MYDKISTFFMSELHMILQEVILMVYVRITNFHLLTSPLSIQQREWNYGQKEHLVVDPKLGNLKYRHY
jgi:hypothetical protein